MEKEAPDEQRDGKSEISCGTVESYAIAVAVAEMRCGTRERKTLRTPLVTSENPASESPKGKREKLTGIARCAQRDRKRFAFLSGNCADVGTGLSH